MIYLDVNTVRRIHKTLLNEYGGLDGVRDEGLLSHLCQAPSQSFDGEDLYKGVLEKASKYLVGFCQSQVFMDGNKRTGTGCMLVFLSINGYNLKMSDNELYDLSMRVSDNSMDVKSVARYLENKI